MRNYRCYECGSFPLSQDDTEVVAGHILCEDCASQYKDEEEMEEEN